MPKTRLDPQARAIRELASDRRVTARRLPFDFALTGALATSLFFAPRQPGLWVFFALGAAWTAGGLYVVVSTTRRLADTRPEERGKRSDDKALGRAQRDTYGCLGLLFAGAAGFAFLVHEGRGFWPWQPWVVALGGTVGLLAGIAVIQWSRRSHRRHDPPPAAGP